MRAAVLSCVGSLNNTFNTFITTEVSDLQMESFVTFDLISFVHILIHIKMSLQSNTILINAPSS